VYESTWGWRRVGKMIAGMGWGWDFFFLQKFSGVGDKLCGNGWGWGSLGNPVQASNGQPACKRLIVGLLAVTI